MPNSTFIVADDFAEQIGKAVHNLSTHTFKIALSNTAPAGTEAVLADITQIANGGGYTGGAGGGYVCDGVTYTETGGTGTFTFTDEVIVASGGSVGPFRYLWIYNDTASSPADALVGRLDYGSALTLADGESLTVDLGGTGIMQVTTP